MQQLIINTRRRYWAPGAEKNLKNNEKYSKNLEIANIYPEEHSITSRDPAVTHYEILEEVPWLLRLEKPKKKTNHFKKVKNCNFQKLLI